jgi:hypothetical protein
MVSSLVAAITGRRSSRKNPKNFDPDPPFDPPLGVKAEMLKTEMPENAGSTDPLLPRENGLQQRPICSDPAAHRIG